ncbi:MAG TPA: TIM barrel protein [Kofleriaceae bacterium]|nr:TIM barrel protein [Kofleriaceae bacterium]
MTDRPERGRASPTRRAALLGLLGTGGLAACSGVQGPGASAPAPASGPRDRSRRSPGGPRQSLAYWTFARAWTVEQACRVAAELGCNSVEAVQIQDWPVLKNYGLTCAFAGTIDLVTGLIDAAHRDRNIAAVRADIEAYAQWKMPDGVVFTTTGVRAGVDTDEAIGRCVDAYKQIMGLAEQRGVTVGLEMMSSREEHRADRLVGVPDYFGDSLEVCAEIVRRVGSPRLGLVVDLYFLQVMEGDLLERLRRHKDLIVHVQLAGVPERFEPDADQEINFPVVIRELARLGYPGHIGHEFYPRGDALAGLTAAVDMVDHAWRSA